MNGELLYHAESLYWTMSSRTWCGILVLFQHLDPESSNVILNLFQYQDDKIIT